MGELSIGYEINYKISHHNIKNNNDVIFKRDLIFKTQLNTKNFIQAINSYVVLLLTLILLTF